jgi:hypothetical protein
MIVFDTQAATRGPDHRRASGVGLEDTVVAEPDAVIPNLAHVTQ